MSNDDAFTSNASWEAAYDKGMAFAYAHNRKEALVESEDSANPSAFMEGFNDTAEDLNNEDRHLDAADMHGCDD